MTGHANDQGRDERLARCVVRNSVGLVDRRHEAIEAGRGRNVDGYGQPIRRPLRCDRRDDLARHLRRDEIDRTRVVDRIRRRRWGGCRRWGGRVHAVGGRQGQRGPGRRLGRAGPGQCRGRARTGCSRRPDGRQAVPGRGSRGAHCSGRRVVGLDQIPADTDHQAARDGGRIGRSDSEGQLRGRARGRLSGEIGLVETQPESGDGRLDRRLETVHHPRRAREDICSRETGSQDDRTMEAVRRRVGVHLSDIALAADAGVLEEIAVEAWRGAPDPVDRALAGKDRGDVIGGSEEGIGDDRVGAGPDEPGRVVVDPLLADLERALREPRFRVATRIAEMAEDHDGVSGELDLAADDILTEVLMRVAGTGRWVQPEAVLGHRVEGIAIATRPPVSVAEIEDDRCTLERLADRRPRRVRRIDPDHVRRVLGGRDGGFLGEPAIPIRRRANGPDDDDDLGGGPRFGRHCDRHERPGHGERQQTHDDDDRTALHRTQNSPQAGDGTAMRLFRTIQEPRYLRVCSSSICGALGHHKVSGYPRPAQGGTRPSPPEFSGAADGQLRQATASTSMVGRPLVARQVITAVCVRFVSDLANSRTR